MSGFAEWARFWLLLGHRRDWDEDIGQHWLWLRTGGSAGHAGLWHLDVAEGKPSDPGGRRWETSLVGATEGNRNAAQERDAAKAAAKEADRRKTIDEIKVKIVETVGQIGDSHTFSSIRTAVGRNGQNFADAFWELVKDGSLVKDGRSRGTDTYKLKPDED